MRSRGDRMSRTHNLNAVKDARIRSAASVRGSKHTHGSSQFASQQSQAPLGAPPSRIEVISTGISQTVAPPPASSQDRASQNVEGMVQDLVRSSQKKSDTMDLEPTQIEDISSEGEISDSDQEEHSGTCSNELLNTQEELDSFPSPVVTKTPLWKFAEQTIG